MHSIVIHYDVEEHFVRLDTFFSGALAAQKSLTAVNRLFFGNQLVPEIVVLPPVSGSLLQKIGVRFRQTVLVVGAVYGTFWATVQLIDSPFIQEVSIELFGETPTQLIVSKIRELRLRAENGEVDAEQLEQESKELLEDFVARAAQRNLELPRGALREAPIPEQLRFELEDAQTDLFLGALDDPDVRAIGFSGEPDFPIPRNGFAERAIRPRLPREARETIEDWTVSQRRVLVTSPNFDREDQSYRKWKGRDASGTNLLFEIVDEEFWLKLHEKEIEFSEDTILEIQMVSHKVDGRIVDHRALRVLRINDFRIAEPLTDEALRAILGKYKLSDSIIGITDLFDDQD